jgi:hypothetical protein
MLVDGRWPAPKDWPTGCSPSVIASRSNVGLVTRRSAGTTLAKGDSFHLKIGWRIAFGGCAALRR